MEWFQAALDRYKQQQHQPQTHHGSRVLRSHPMRSVPAPIVYSRTRSVQIPESVLREQRILAGFDAGPFVDAFKILRTQVMHRVKERGWNVIGITSPGQGEGKTFTAVNLAASLAMDVTQSVLLVDANLRHPTVHEMFDLGPCRGLADYLLDDVPIEELLVHPGIGRFVFLPGGHAVSHSAEALTSPKMVALVEEFKHRYQSRMILFDLPPLLQTSDVLAFAPYLDALLLVVQEGHTKAEDVERSLALVKQATPVLGTMVNKVGYGAATPAGMKAMMKVGDV